MSFDLAVWADTTPITAERAQQKYRALLARDESRSAADSRLSEFLAELLRRFPAADQLPEALIDECAWATGRPDTVADGAVLAISTARASEVAPAVHDLAARHGLVCFDPQSRTVHQAVEAPNLLVLRMADGTEVEGPDAETVRRLVNGLSQANWYAILERSPETYVQAGLGRSAGAPAGRFAVERRDGSADRHFRCLLTDRDQVVQIFLAFATGDQGWAERAPWQRITL